MKYLRSSGCLKIPSERASPGRHDAIFSNRKLPSSAVRMRKDDVITELCIADEGDSEQGASRQQI